MIDAAVHRLEDHHHLFALADRRGPLEGLDALGVHLLLGHARLVVARDDAHLAGLQLVGDLAGLFDGRDEGVFLLRVVHAGAKSPGGELGNGDARLLGRGSQPIGIAVAAFVRPDFDGRKAEVRRLLKAVEIGCLAEPHFDVDGEFGVLGLAERLWIDGGLLGSTDRLRADGNGGGSCGSGTGQQRATGEGHG